MKLKNDKALLSTFPPEKIGIVESHTSDPSTAARRRRHRCRTAHGAKKGVALITKRPTYVYTKQL